jgi:hypothetical protein
VAVSDGTSPRLPDLLEVARALDASCTPDASS